MNKIVIGLLFVLGVFSISAASTKSANQEAVVLSADNTLVLNSEVNGDSVGALIVKAKELDAKLGHGKPLYLYLNTPGGSIQSGLELIEVLNGLGRPVHTVTVFGASMGFQIAQNLDTRYILKSGILMSHRAAGQFQGSFGGTSPSQIDERMHVFVQMTKEMDEQTVKRTNGKQTLKSYQEAYANEMWLTGQEAVAGGYADKVTNVKCDKTLGGTSKHQVEFLGMIIQYETDNCPINSSPLNVKVGGSVVFSEEYRNLVKTQFITNYELKAQTPVQMKL